MFSVMEKRVKKILMLNNVALDKADLNIIQMLHFCQSKIIVLSAGSTFGQLA
jgi:hypothetical protein